MSSNDLNKYEYDFSNNSAKIKRYVCNSSELTMPSTTKFENQDFTIIEIQDKAFKKNTTLQKIDLGQSSVTTIGRKAFSKSNLKEIILPSSIKFIDGFCESARQLKDVSIADYNPENSLIKIYRGRSGYFLLSSNDALVFTSRGIQKVSLKQHSIAYIASGAFSDCVNLTSISIPTTITQIQSNAFLNCSQLNEVSFEATKYKTPNIQIISKNAFKQCTSLSTIYFPNSLKSIGVGAFADCTSLNSIEFDENKSTLEEISSEAFRGCNHLETINIPLSIKIIGASAFFNTRIGSLSLPKYISQIEGFCIGARSLNKIELSYKMSETKENPIELAHLENNSKILIAYNENRQMIVIFASRDVISASIPKTVLPASIHKTVLPASIGDGAFCECSSLKSIQLNPNIERIGRYSFYECTSLKTIIIPKSVKKIGDYAFASCHSLESVYFEPHSELEKIGNFAFNNCCELKYISIPHTIQEIGDYAFYNTNLRYVSLTKRIKTIGKYAFVRDLASPIDKNTLFEYCPKIADGNFIVFYINEIANGKSLKEAVRLYQRESKNGDLDATVKLALCYENGTGIDENKNEALKLFERADKGGNADGSFYLGYYNENLGHCTEAVSCYKRAYELGNLKAMCKLGCLYLKEHEVDSSLSDENKRQSFAFFNDASSKGYLNGTYNLALCYQYGIGVKVDLSQAVQYYKKISNWIILPGIYNLAICYLYGYGVKKNIDEAICLLKRSSDCGFAHSTNLLAYCYQNGMGVEQNLNEAVRLYTIASEMGNEIASYNLAVCYLNGSGIEKNIDEAIRLLRISSECFADAYYLLAHCYEQGIGVEQNWAEAVRLCEEASKKERAASLYNVGVSDPNGITSTDGIEQADRFPDGQKIDPSKIKDYSEMFSA